MGFESSGDSGLHAPGAVKMRIEQRGSKWVVLPESGDKVLGEHDTKEQAEAQLRAIEASRHAASRAAGRLFSVRSFRFSIDAAVGKWSRVATFGDKRKDGAEMVFDATTLGQMVDNAARRGDPIAVCADHLSAYVAETGQQAPALAWFDALAVVADGQVVKSWNAAPDGTGLADGLYARMSEITPRGADPLLGLGNYKFLSPMFSEQATDEAGNEIGMALFDVAATNTPFQAGTEIQFHGRGAEKVARQIDDEDVSMSQTMASPGSLNPGNRVRHKDGREEKLRVAGGRHVYVKWDDGSESSVPAADLTKVGDGDPQYIGYSATNATGAARAFSTMGGGVTMAIAKGTYVTVTGGQYRGVKGQVYKINGSKVSIETTRGDTYEVESSDVQETSDSGYSRFSQESNMDETEMARRFGWEEGDDDKTKLAKCLAKMAAEAKPLEGNETPEEERKGAEQMSVKMSVLEAANASMATKLAALEAAEAKRAAEAAEANERKFAALADAAVAGGYDAKARDGLIKLARTDFAAAEQIASQFKMMGRVTRNGAPVSTSDASVVRNDVSNGARIMGRALSAESKKLLAEGKAPDLAAAQVMAIRANPALANE